MGKPTRDDASMVLQLAQLASQMGLPRATDWLWSNAFAPSADEFAAKYPRGTDESRMVRTIAAFFETTGTLWKHGLVNEELLFDWLWVEGVWDRLKDILTRDRQVSGSEQLWENFEAMARAQSG